MVQFAVAPGVSRVADLRHFGNALVKGEPQRVLIQGAILARAKRDHHELLLAEH
ncbi:hypothetical protein D3C87_1784420 [compost metagenome]